MDQCAGESGAAVCRHLLHQPGHARCIYLLTASGLCPPSQARFPNTGNATLPTLFYVLLGLLALNVVSSMPFSILPPPTPSHHPPLPPIPCLHPYLPSLPHSIFAMSSRLCHSTFGCCTAKANSGAQDWLCIGFHSRCRAPCAHRSLSCKSGIPVSTGFCTVMAIVNLHAPQCANPQTSILRFCQYQSLLHRLLSGPRITA